MKKSHESESNLKMSGERGDALDSNLKLRRRLRSSKRRSSKQEPVENKKIRIITRDSYKKGKKRRKETFLAMVWESILLSGEASIPEIARMACVSSTHVRKVLIENGCELSVSAETLQVYKMNKLLAKFEENSVRKENGCVEWRRRESCNEEKVARIKINYPLDSLKTTPLEIPKAAYIIFIGPIEEGKIVSQKCGNPLCINPDHLTLRAKKTRKKLDSNELGE